MKFCGNCGKQLEDTEMFCSSCGAVQDANNSSAEAPKTAGETAQEYGKKAVDFAQDQFQNIKKMDIKKIAIAVVAAVVALILVVNVFRTFIHGTGTITVKGAVKEYITYDKVEDYLDVTMTNKMQKAYKEEMEDTVDDYDEFIDECNDDMDDDVEYKNIKIDKKKKLSKSKAKAYTELIEDNLDVKAKVSKVYKVNVSYKVRYEDGDWDKKETTLYIGKISGNYYVLNDIASISFGSSLSDLEDYLGDLEDYFNY